MTRGRWAVGLVIGMVLAACVPAHAIVLRYRPKVDEVTKHRLTMAGRMQTSMPGMSQGMQLELNGSMDYSEKALSETEEASRVETRVLGGSVTIKVNGESHSEQMPQGRMVADMDRRGRLVEMIEADFGDAGAGSPFGSPGADAWTNMPSQVGAFPEGNVEVNDKWADVLKMPTAPGAPEINLAINSELLALTTFQNRKCAKIRTTFEGPMSMDLSQAGGGGPQMQGTMEATLQGEMLWYYDYEKSVQVYSEGSVGIDMTISMPGGSMTSQMLMNVKMALAN